MALKIREIKMPQSKYGLKCPYAMTPEFVVIHNTANDASAENEIKYMQSNDREVSFHCAVDDKEAVFGLPLNRNAWHAGDGGSGDGNRSGIAVEICYSKSGGARFDKAEDNAAYLTAKLLKERGWGVDRVKKHQDFSGKNCPHRTLENGWERFIAKVGKYLTEGDNASLRRLEDSYTANGVTFTRAKNFAVKYFDADKRKGKYTNYINGGFFAYYRDESGTPFTLPVGHIACDVKTLPSPAEKYLRKYVSGGKLIYPASANQSGQFKNKAVSTLVVTLSGEVYIKPVFSLPKDVKYALSGVPVVVEGKDASFANDVSPQGWGEDSMYGASRNMLGVRNGEIWILTLKTSSYNYIRTSEVWNKIKDEGFDDVISLDGGGSYYRKDGAKRRSNGGSRSVNNLVVF